MRVRGLAGLGLRTAVAVAVACGLAGLGAGPASAAAPGCKGWTGGEPPASGPVPLGTAVVTVSGCDVWVAEASSLVHWTGGSSWTSFSLPAGFTVSSMAAAAANDVWAVGDAVTGPSQSATLVLHWDGTNWIRKPSPSPGTADLLSSVHVTSATDAWAVGATNSAGASEQALIEHWDGSNWVQRAAPAIQANRMNTVTAVSASTAWAGGEEASATAPVTAALIESWNGQAWSPAFSLPGSDTPGDSSAIKSMSAVSATDAWAVGTVHGGTRTLILHWDGQHWNLTYSPNPDTSPGAKDKLASVVALSASNAWAFGTASAGPFALHWDGTRWAQTVMPTGITSTGDASASGGDIWVTGSDPVANDNGAVPLAQAQIAVNANAALGLSGWVTKSVPAANLAPGTNPAVATAADGSWEAAWQAASGLLWTLDSSGKQVSTQQKAAAGTSPAAVAVPGGGFELAFISAAGGTPWLIGPGGQAHQAGNGPAAAAGTSPVLASDGHTVEAAYHAAGAGHLWTVDASGTAHDTGAVMATGASPAIAGLPGGGFQLAYPDASGKLTGLGPDGSTRALGSGPTVAAGTSPAVAAAPAQGGGFEAVYAAAGPGELWSVDPSGTSHDLGVAAAPQTSPAITALVSGGFQIAYQASTGRELFTLTGAGPARDTGFALGVHDSPAMSALPPVIPGTTTVPDLHGDTDGEARAALTQAGLTAGSITADNSCRASIGRVASQSPAAGQPATAGDPVSLGESTGKTAQGGPCNPLVPNLFGDSDATARQAIAAQGLTVGAVTTGPSCIVNKGDVFDQNPTANTPAQPGQAVSFTESNGKDRNGKPCNVQ